MRCDPSLTKVTVVSCQSSVPNQSADNPDEHDVFILLGKTCCKVAPSSWEEISKVKNQSFLIVYCNPRGQPVEVQVSPSAASNDSQSEQARSEKRVKIVAIFWGAFALWTYLVR